MFEQSSIEQDRENETNLLQRQIKDYKAKLGLISIAADEDNLAKVKELIPPSCADVVREMRAEAVLGFIEYWNERFKGDFGLDASETERYAKHYATQLRNPEQEKV